MAIEEHGVWERVPLDDPNCCKAVTNRGPCNIKAIEGRNYCRVHFGFGAKNEENQKARNFRLNIYQRRVNDFADNDQVKSLREEIGILRMLLEEVVNKCNNATDLIIASNKIADLAIRIEKLVVSCHKLEQSTGSLLDKTTVLILADTFIQIAGEVIPPDKIDYVSERLMKTIESVTTNDTTT